jgi:hypothetical protein
MSGRAQACIRANARVISRSAIFPALIAFDGGVKRNPAMNGVANPWFRGGARDG